MGLLRTIGVALTYLGILVMVVGLISLVLGISAMFTEVSGQMKQGYEQVACANPPCGEALSQTQPDNAMAGVNQAADELLEPVGEVVDLYMQQMGVLPMPDPHIEQMAYPNIRRFFSMLAVGLCLILLGMLFKIWDSVTEFIEGRRHNKEKRMIRRSRLYREQPVRY